VKDTPVSEYFPDHRRVFDTGKNFTSSPHSLQVSISILNTRFNLLAQVIVVWRSNSEVF
jgi:hypothetical protein